jgi:hypothetical protein
MANSNKRLEVLRKKQEEGVITKSELAELETIEKMEIELGSEEGVTE